MDWKKLYSVLNQKFDAQRCLERVRRIWETDRYISYDRYEETARYCADSMNQADLAQVEMLPLKADGKTLYHDWRIPQAWKVTHGTLRYADGTLLVDYHREPCGLSMYSPATPGPVEAEVVDVTGLETLPKDGSLKGKILFTDRTVAQMQAEAWQAGALGVLSYGVTLIYPGIRDSKEDVYDAHLWERMRRDDWDNPVFGFKLTPRQGDQMLQRLAQGPVRVVADIAAEFYDGVSYVVSGLLPGTEPALDEVFAYGHLYEPGANDNASGCAALLELAYCMQEAIEEGLLPRPRRGIRFGMGEECAGSMGYFATHPNRKMLCAGVFDMVGTEKIDRTNLSLRYNPLASASYADAALDLSADICRQMDGVDYDFKRHPMRISIGTDNIIADPSFHTPAIALVAAPATSYHSSMDTPERIEPEILKRNALILGVYLFGLADADAQTCRMLAQEMRRQMDAELAAEPDACKQRHLQETMERSLYSLKRICPDLPYEKPVEQIPPMPDYAAEMGKWVPVREIVGCLNLFAHPDTKNTRWKPGWNPVLNIPLFWIDGTRNLWEIAVQTAFEMQMYSDAGVKEKYTDLAEYFTFLAELGYIRWAKQA